MGTIIGDSIGTTLGFHSHSLLSTREKSYEYSAWGLCSVKLLALSRHETVNMALPQNDMEPTVL